MGTSGHNLDTFNIAGKFTEIYLLYKSKECRVTQQLIFIRFKLLIGNAIIVTYLTMKLTDVSYF